MKPLSEKALKVIKDWNNRQILTPEYESVRKELLEGGFILIDHVSAHNPLGSTLTRKGVNLNKTLNPKPINKK